MVFSDDPIDLNALRDALVVLAELDYLDLSSDCSAEDAAPEALGQARRDFVQHLRDNWDRENDVRRALAWLLNQDDARLARFRAAALLPFPVGDLAQLRRFLESLWASAFAGWRDQGSPMEELEILGLASATEGEAERR